LRDTTLSLSLTTPLSSLRLFFSHYHHPPLLLHSFPTRRSSDLPQDVFSPNYPMTGSTTAMLRPSQPARHGAGCEGRSMAEVEPVDRKSTRLNSSHLGISYAVFCLKKKKKKNNEKINIKKNNHIH